MRTDSVQQMNLDTCDFGNDKESSELIARNSKTKSPTATKKEIVNDSIIQFDTFDALD